MRILKTRWKSGSLFRHGRIWDALTPTGSKLKVSVNPILFIDEVANREEYTIGLVVEKVEGRDFE